MTVLSEALAGLDSMVDTAIGNRELDTLELPATCDLSKAVDAISDLSIDHINFMAARSAIEALVTETEPGIRLLAIALLRRFVAKQPKVIERLSWVTRTRCRVSRLVASHALRWAGWSSRVAPPTLRRPPVKWSGTGAEPMACTATRRRCAT